MTDPSTDDTSTRPTEHMLPHSRVGTIVLLGVGALVALAICTSIGISLVELAQK